MAYELTTLANVKEYMALTVATYDTLLENMIDRFTELADSFTGRKLAARDYSYLSDAAAYDPDNAVLDGNGLDAIALPQRPINSITTLRINEMAIDANTGLYTIGYVIDRAAGILRLRGYLFTKGLADIELVWNGGYSTIPKDLEDAALKQVAFWFKESPAGSNLLGVTSKTMPDGSVSYTTRDLLPEVKTVLERYRQHFAL